MVTTVSDKGSSYGGTGKFKPNRLGVQQEMQDVTGNLNFKAFKVIIDLLMKFSLPGGKRVLRDHLLWLFVAIIYVMSCIKAVNACPEPSVTEINGYRIPDIHPCNSRVNLAGRGIQGLHFEGLYDMLRDLNVSNNNIEHLLREVFHGMELQHLDLSQNQIIVLAKDRFYGSSIEWIDLSRNNITHIFEGAFNGLQDSLQFLNLSFNHLEKLSNGAFSNLRFICHLDLSNNNLVFIDKYAFTGTNDLLYLNLKNNHLTTVSGWLPQIGHTLDVSSNNLTTTEGLPQNASIILYVSLYSQLACSPETIEFKEWCLEAKEYCYSQNDLNKICYDDIDHVTSGGESPSTTDPKTSNGGKSPHDYCVHTYVLLVLVGFCVKYLL